MKILNLTTTEWNGKIVIETEGKAYLDIDNAILLIDQIETYLDKACAEEEKRQKEAANAYATEGGQEGGEA